MSARRRLLFSVNFLGVAAAAWAGQPPASRPARAVPPSTGPTTTGVRTTIVVDGKPVVVRGRVCSVVNDDGVVTVNGRPLAEVIDVDPPATHP